MWEVPNDWHIVGTGDFNGDGLADLLWRNDDGTITDWLATPSLTFEGNDANLLINPGTAWNIVGVGDFNYDGKSDVVWGHNSGLTSDWLASGSGGLTDNSANFQVNPGTAWHIVGTGDFNGDHYVDILWRNDDGLVSDWLGKADGGFTENGLNSNINPGPAWQIAATGDFNGDGRADILWRNADGLVSEWLGQGNGGFTDNSANFQVNPGTSWSIVGTGDFNADGYTDILWHNSSGLTSDWLGSESGSMIQNAELMVGTNWQVAGVGDFNGDGRADILWRAADGTVDYNPMSAGGLLSPTAKQTWEQAMANVSQFLSEMVNAADAYTTTPTGNDQSSYYDDGEDRAGIDLSLGYWLGSAATPVELLSQNTNTSFDLFAFEGDGFSAAFDGHFGSVNLADSANNLFNFDIDGLLLTGTWHDSAPPAAGTGSPGEIIVTGTRTGYFTFVPTDNGFNFGGIGGSSSVPALTPQSYATSDLALASLHAQLLSASDRNTKEHFAIIYHDASGYHTSPLFLGDSLQGNLSPLFSWMALNGVSFSEVTSLYHNHDSYQYGTTGEAADINRYPSLKDWRSAADFFVHPGGQIAGADPSVFTLSLEDTDHAVRYFSYSQEATYVTLLQDPENNMVGSGIDLPNPVIAR